MTFAHICAILAAKRCAANGMTVKNIALQAKRHPSTIRRWINT
jgi:transposase